MSDSILDRVLSSKEDQEKQEFDPIEVMNQLLRVLSSKEADVLRRRYGLTERGKETLETIGAHYSVTRERIRQIENQSIEKMKQSPQYADIIRPVEHLIISLLSHHGDLMSQEMMFESLLNVYHSDEQKQQSVSFIINELLSDKIERVPKKKKYNLGWKLKLVSMDFMDTVIEQLALLATTVGTPQSFEDVYTVFQNTDLYKANDSKLTEEAVMSYIEVSTKLARNPFDEYGLARWGLIQPKRMNDRVFLVLQKETKPMHFEDIAESISKIFKKKAYPPTVHNELILNKEYVLVGRGIYALKEWGFTEGVVSDVIADVMKQSSGPMSRADIVNAVLEQRIVKRNTIHLALTDKKLFTKTKDGQYHLSEPHDKPVHREEPEPSIDPSPPIVNEETKTEDGPVAD